MEVLGDAQFRAAIRVIGGMDEAVHEFIRITSANSRNVAGVLRNKYKRAEMGSIPLAAQIMGGDPNAIGEAAHQLAHIHRAPRVDLNVGCPAKRVNGNGAGASLLQTPQAVYDITSAMVRATLGTDTTVSVKMRSGYESTALFRENVCAARDAGAALITIHPRTKRQAYSGDADWSLIKEAKEIVGCSAEIVGNGDVLTANDAMNMLRRTGCDHVMVGRGAVRNPFIFWDMREAWAAQQQWPRGATARSDELDLRVPQTLASERAFYNAYLSAAGGVDGSSPSAHHRMKISRLKMILRYSASIDDRGKQALLRSDGGENAGAYLEEVLSHVAEFYDNAARTGAKVGAVGRVFPG